MPAPRSIASFLLSSVAALCSAWLGPPGSISPCALALYPWIVLAGLPGGPPRGRPRAQHLTELALDALVALPPIVIALRLEAGHGWTAAPWSTALPGWAMFLGLASGASLASRGRGQQLAWASVWLGMLLLALARAATELGVGSDGLPPVLASAAAGTPFAWVHDRAGGGSASALLPCAWILAALLALGVAGRSSQRVPSLAEQP